MKKVIRLTESDIENIVRKVIATQLNEVQIKGTKNKFYMLTPEDEDYKKWVQDRLDGRTQADKQMDDSEAYFADWVNKGNRYTALTEMYKLMDETSSKIFDSMPESFKAYCVAFYMGKVDELRKQFITADNPTSSQQTPGGSEIQEPGYTFSSETAKFNDQFEFNEAVLSNEFKSYINEVVTQAGEALKTAPGTTGNGELKSITVKASSSKIPNTESKVTFPGKVPTFCELTEARAKAVEQYVIKAFESVNIKPSSDIKVNISTKGDNGDCTSGPDWKQGQDKEPYKKYQRADIGFTYAIRTSVSPEEEGTEPESIEVQTYVVTMGGRKRKPRVPREPRWPNINLRISGGGSFTPTPVLCDVYRDAKR